MRKSFNENKRKPTLLPLMLGMPYILKSNTMQNLIAPQSRPRSGSFLSKLPFFKNETEERTTLLTDNQAAYPLALFENILSSIDKNEEENTLSLFSTFVTKTTQLISDDKFLKSKTQPDIVKKRLLSSILTLILMAHDKHKKRGRKLFNLLTSDIKHFPEFTILLKSDYVINDILATLIENNDYLAIAFLIEKNALPKKCAEPEKDISTFSEASLIVHMATEKATDGSATRLIDYLCEIGNDPKLESDSPLYAYYQRIKALQGDSKSEILTQSLGEYGFQV